MENAAFTSVHWNNKGDTVVIKADLFQTEVLQGRGVGRIFETASRVSSVNWTYMSSVKSILWVALRGKRG